MPVHVDPFWQVIASAAVPHLKGAVAPAGGWHTAALGAAGAPTVQAVPNVPAQFATAVAAVAAAAANAGPWAACPDQAGAQVVTLSHFSAKLGAAAAVIPLVAA